MLESHAQQPYGGWDKTSASLCTFTTARPTLYEIINKANLHEPRQRARRFTTETQTHALERKRRKVKKVDPASAREATSPPLEQRQTTAGARKLVGTTSSGSRSKAKYAAAPLTYSLQWRRAAICKSLMTIMTYLSSGPPLLIAIIANCTCLRQLRRGSNFNCCCSRIW